MAEHRIYRMTFASVYPHYLAKVEKKGRTKAELDQVIRWLTGYSQPQLRQRAKAGSALTFEDFFGKAPSLNPSRMLVTGTICGVRVEAIDEPLMREIRILDKLVDELARGRAMEKVLREPAEASAPTPS